MTIRYYSYFGEENCTHVMFGNDITKENWVDFVLNREFGDMDIQHLASTDYFDSYQGIFDNGAWKVITIMKDFLTAEIEVAGGNLGFYVLSED